MSAACLVCTWPSDSTNVHAREYMLAWERGNVLLGTKLARCCVMVWEQDKRSFRFVSVFRVLPTTQVRVEFSQQISMHLASLN